MPDPVSDAVVHKPDWKDFRDHIPTADPSGKRIWLFPRKPWGPLYRARTVVNLVLLAIMFGGPFIRIGGEPLLMFNLPARKFVIFGQIFGPGDNYIFAIAMVTLLVMIVLFTAVFGRLWCGWLCPQTVLMEGVFRRIEYWIEGNSFQQRKLAAAPWTTGKILRKTLKHVVFFAISFVCGNVLLSYIIGSDALLQVIRDPVNQHATGFTAMLMFTLVFYGIFARFREQACTFICPYGRFQSVLLDSNSIVVSYDHKRGNPFGRWDKRLLPAERRNQQGLGDCINCRLCVDVCPTGIDIRNGTQMECVNCTACIDACNHTMSKVGLPKGLIRYASFNSIARGERLRITPRIVMYSVILCALFSLLVYLLIKRTDVEASLLRAPGILYVPAGADFANIYTMKLINKTHQEMPIELRLEGEDAGGHIEVSGATTAIPDQVTEARVVVTLPRAALRGASTPIEIGVYENGKRIQLLKTNFAGPSP